MSSDNQTCDIFRYLFNSKVVSFNGGGISYVVFGDICAAIEHILRSHYLAFLLLKFFDKESTKLVEPNFDKSSQNSMGDEYNQISDDKKLSDKILPDKISDLDDLSKTKEGHYLYRIKSYDINESSSNETIKYRDLKK